MPCCPCPPVQGDAGVQPQPLRRHEGVPAPGFPCSDGYLHLLAKVSASSSEKDFLNGRKRDLLALDFIFL